MKTITTIIASVGILGLYTAPGAYAQNGQDQCCQQHGASKTSTTAGGRMFNPQTVETIRGEVMEVQQSPGPNGRGQGMHLQVRTENGNIPVFLGPDWFIKNQDVQIKPHDQVEIRGSRITFQGHSALVASRVTDGDQVLQLRDNNGRPAWSAWRSAAGGNPSLSMAERGSGSSNENMPGRQRWMREHQKVLQELKKMDAELDKKAAAMNQAQGDEKVAAMQAAINELIKQRETIDRHIERLAERGYARMQARQERMGRPGSAQGGMSAEDEEGSAGASSGQGGMGNSNEHESHHQSGGNW